MSELTTENEKIICDGCKNPSTIMKGNKTKLCPDCKKQNFIELLNDIKNGRK